MHMSPTPALGQSSSLPSPVCHPGEVLRFDDRSVVKQSPTVQVGPALRQVAELLPCLLPCKRTERGLLKGFQFSFGPLLC